MLNSVFAALILTFLVIIGIFMTFAVSRLLSGTLLKGIPSSFTLELPPYRRPQIGKVIVRSVLDRTLFVLGRAAAVAAPAGLVIWLMANLTVNEISLLNHCASVLDPFAKLFGLDGVILIAFILGLPANEIGVSNHNHGISGAGKHFGAWQSGRASHPAGSKWMDLITAGKHGAFFTDALAVFYYAHYNKKGNRKSQMDDIGVSDSYSDRACRMFSLC